MKFFSKIASVLTLCLMLALPFALSAGCAGGAAVKESSVITTGSSVTVTKTGETSETAATARTNRKM